MSECDDCGQATLGPGVCVDCTRARFDLYPMLKARLVKIIDITEKILVETNIEDNSKSIETLREILDIGTGGQD